METKREWPSRDAFAEKLKHTRQRNLILRVPGIMAKAPKAFRLTPLYLSGDAGTGKGYAALSIAKALGWRMIKALPSQVEGILAKEFSLAKQAVPTVLFVDESHAKEEGKGDTLFLKLTDTSDSPVYEGGEGENVWAFDQRIHLLILASNRGEPNPALVGEKGRMAEIAMLPFAGEDLKWFISLNMERVARECDVTFSPTVAPFILSMTSGIARNVEDLTNAIGEVYHGKTVTGEMIRQVAMQLVGPDKKPLLCPFGMNGKIVSLMQELAERGVLRENALKGKLGESSRVFASVKRALTSANLMEACSKGFCITKEGIALLEKIDSVLCEEIKEPAPPKPKVKKGGKAK